MMMLRTLLCACFASAWPHDAWSSCNRLLEARYYETSLLACTGLACVGDGLAQAIEHRRDHRRARARSEAPPPRRAPRLDRARMRDFAVSSALVDGALEFCPLTVTIHWMLEPPAPSIVTHRSAVCGVCIEHVCLTSNSGSPRSP